MTTLNGHFCLCIALTTRYHPQSPGRTDVQSNMTEPTPQDPEEYLALFKFSRRIRCPRTTLPVSYADMGDEGGTPLLSMMPSGGSRWFAAARGKFISPITLAVDALDTRCLHRLRSTLQKIRRQAHRGRPSGLRRNTSGPAREAYRHVLPYAYRIQEPQLTC